MIRYYYIHRLQIKKEGKIERKKERKKERAQNLNLLIVIQLTYTRIGFVYLILVLVCQGSVPLVQRTRFFSLFQIVIK